MCASAKKYTTQIINTLDRFTAILTQHSTVIVYNIKRIYRYIPMKRQSSKSERRRRANCFFLIFSINSRGTSAGNGSRIRNDRQKGARATLLLLLRYGGDLAFFNSACQTPHWGIVGFA